MAAEQRNWSALVGKDGKEAVEVIKKDTGIVLEKNQHLN